MGKPAEPRPLDELLTSEQLSDYLGVTTGHLAQLRYTGDGPRFVKITGKQVRYRRTDVAAWLDARSRTRTDGFDREAVAR